MIQLFDNDGTEYLRANNGRIFIKMSRMRVIAEDSSLDLIELATNIADEALPIDAGLS